MAISSYEVTKAAGSLRKYREHPELFVRQVFGVEPDAWQDEVLKSFGDPGNRRIAMKACKGPGKSTVLAWLAWNFLLTRPYPKIAATSITGDNLADGLWTEMSKWQGRSELLAKSFTWTKTRIFLNESPETWWMSARTWPRSADASQQADTLAGLHADYLLFILDEAGGIPNAVMATAEAGLSTGVESRLIQAGNPTHLEGPLYQACTAERHLWKLFEVTGDPEDPRRSPRISTQWAQEQIQKYGRDNSWVKVNVFGEFPAVSQNALVGPDECQASIERELPKDHYEFEAKIIGVDVARFGDDRTVIIGRQGRKTEDPIILRNARTHVIAARVAKLWDEWGADACFVDDTGGWGAGVIDALIQHGRAPTPVNFSGSPIDERYLNKRAEVWFLLAEWIKTGGKLPNTQEIIAEMTAPTYEFNRGRFKLEEKEQIKSRLGFSPDVADALALTFSFPVRPRAVRPTQESWRDRLRVRRHGSPMTA
jgi:hypothetical protein